jgi:hypothetical protein
LRFFEQAIESANQVLVNLVDQKITDEEIDEYAKEKQDSAQQGCIEQS